MGSSVKVLCADCGHIHAEFNSPGEHSMQPPKECPKCGCGEMTFSAVVAGPAGSGGITARKPDPQK